MISRKADTYIIDNKCWSAKIPVEIAECEAYENFEKWKSKFKEKAIDAHRALCKPYKTCKHYNNQDCDDDCEYMRKFKELMDR